MPSGEITGQQRHFLRLYLGRDNRYHGNGTRSYMRAFEITNQRSAQVSASRLLKKPHIKAIVDEAKARALNEHAADAAFVLKQSVHLYDVAMGNVAVEVDVVKPSGDVETVERRDLNLTVAGKALELIGRHTTVQAFQDNVEHTHTHELIERLNARSRMIEERALARAEQQPAIEGQVVVIDDEAGGGEGARKEGASGGGQAGAPPVSPGETPLSEAGAKGE